jgi:hypothetical protein
MLARSLHRVRRLTSIAEVCAALTSFPDWSNSVAPDRKVFPSSACVALQEREFQGSLKSSPTAFIGLLNFLPTTA